jgi:hypothetical protein
LRKELVDASYHAYAISLFGVKRDAVSGMPINSRQGTA